MRYCTKCGKTINYDSPICVDCVARAKNDSQRATPNLYNVPPMVQPPQPVVYVKPTSEPKNTKMDGFGRALTAAILSTVAFFLAVVMLDIEDYSGIFFIFYILPPVIISLIFGIKSITLYSKYTDNKPVPAFVLGIVSVSLAGLALLCSIL